MKKNFSYYQKLTRRLIKRRIRHALSSALTYLSPSSKIYSLGSQGERAACRFLERKYYLIWERNNRSWAGELDIIASQGRTLVFVEVKTRSQSIAEKFSGLEAVNDDKQKRIARAAKYFIDENTSLLRRRRTLKIRFDVVTAVKIRRWPWPFKILHYQGAIKAKNSLQAHLN